MAGKEFITSGGLPEKAARGEAFETINELLAVANLFQAREPLEDEKQIAAELELALTAILDGRPLLYLRWPPLRQRGYDNLVAACAAGLVHLARCRVCQFWFLAKDARQQVCYSEECAKAVKRERDAKNRLVRERNKPAR